MKDLNLLNFKQGIENNILYQLINLQIFFYIIAKRNLDDDNEIHNKIYKKASMKCTLWHITIN